MGQQSASKYVIFNTLVRRLDALLSSSLLRILDRDLNTPPSSPTDGALYIIGPSPTGLWTGNSNKVAYYNATGWEYFTPKSGWVAYIVDEAVFVKYSGSSWGIFLDVLQNVNLLGVNATADTINKFVVSSAATLFNHNGSDHVLKINKNAVGNTAAQQYQTNFSTRAETGLTGDDNYHFKMSPDGSTFYEALVLSKDNGVGHFPQGQFNGTFSLTDDTATSITPPAGMLKSGLFLIHSYDPAGISPVITESAVLWFDVGTTAATTTVNAGSDTNITTGVLAGTTGTDTKVTISAHSDGKIYIENRRGATRNFRYVFIG